MNGLLEEAVVTGILVSVSSIVPRIECLVMAACLLIRKNIFFYPNGRAGGIGEVCTTKEGAMYSSAAFISRVISQQTWDYIFTVSENDSKWEEICTLATQTNSWLRK